jgi:hypothetical protein
MSLMDLTFGIKLEDWFLKPMSMSILLSGGQRFGGKVSYVYSVFSFSLSFSFFGYIGVGVLCKLLGSKFLLMTNRILRFRVS